MARKTVVEVRDNLTDELLPEETEPTFLSVNGVTVKLDLGEGSLGKLNRALKPFFDKGEPVENAPKASRATNSVLTGKAALADTEEIREWAKQNGHQVSDKGRLSNEVLKAFNEYANSEDANVDVDA